MSFITNNIEMSQEERKQLEDAKFVSYLVERFGNDTSILQLTSHWGLEYVLAYMKKKIEGLSFQVLPGDKGMFLFGEKDTYNSAIQAEKQFDLTIAYDIQTMLMISNSPVFSVIFQGRDKSDMLRLFKYYIHEKTKKIAGDFGIEELKPFGADDSKLIQADKSNQDKKIDFQSLDGQVSLKNIETINKILKDKQLSTLFDKDLFLMSKIVNKYNQLEKDRFEEIRKTDYRFREFGLDDEEFGIESQGRRSR